MMGDWPFGLWELLIALAIAVLLYAGSEIGFRYGRRYSARVVAEIHTHVVTVEGAVLGLLALLLGFTFSIILSRYDTRKQLVTSEVATLRSTYLNAQLLTDPLAADHSRLLQEYLAARLAFVQATDPSQRDEARLKTSALQRSLWLQSTAFSINGAGSPYHESLNRLLSDYPLQMAALDDTLPLAVLILLVGVAALAIAVAGYSAGLRRKRLKALRYVLIVLVTATLMLLLDLDRSNRRIVRSHELNLLQLQQDLSTLQKVEGKK